MIRSIFTSLFLFCCCSLLAQNTYERGKIHDSILVKGTTEETFALYLPSSYDKNALNPIVFIFEPAARGAIGIQPFIDASEKYGHILVCSNNSKNGPYDLNFGYANRLFSHIFSTFSIKESDMYLSGFSGGSRLASAVAALTNRFAGVIGCGAGFSNIPGQMPAAHDFDYVGLCGDRDMNYTEMLENKEYLKLVNFNATLITYDDEHRWPPKSEIVRAFDWLYLQKLKKNSAVNADSIQHQYKVEYDLLRKFEEEEQYVFANEQAERMLKSFKNLVNTDSLESRFRQLKKNKSFKKQVAANTEALQQEKKLSGKLLDRLGQDLQNPERANFNWWEKELAKLKEIKNTEESVVKKMIHRIEFKLFASAYSRKNTLIYEGENKELETFIERYTQLIYPKN